MKNKLIIALFFLIGVIAITLKCSGQEQYVEQFYADAKKYGLEVEHKEVIIVITSLDHLNLDGRVDIMPFGKLRIIIDEIFWTVFENESQMQRLIYQLMAKALVKNWEHKGVMNDNNLYRKLTNRDIVRMFKNLV